MADKKMKGSTGYFNKEMREILKKGEEKKPTKPAAKPKKGK